jgi:hypothetical protein
MHMLASAQGYLHTTKRAKSRACQWTGDLFDWTYMNYNSVGKSYWSSATITIISVFAYGAIVDFNVNAAAIVFAKVMHVRNCSVWFSGFFCALNLSTVGNRSFIVAETIPHAISPLPRVELLSNLRNQLPGILCKGTRQRLALVKRHS